VGNALQGLAFRVHLEHAPDGGRFALGNFEFHTVQIPHAAIAEDAAAGVERLQRATLHTAVSLLAELA
jgi:hypothetical protein